MIQIENLSKSYGDRPIFTDVSFHLGDNERCAVVGRNGSGKSTLLKILSGLEEADSGNVHLPKGTTIGSLPQHLHFESPTLLEEAILGLPEHLRDESYRVEIILGGLGFSDEDFSKPPSSFSGGYQLRLALCKVLVGEPDLLLLDEPTNYLDILAIRWLEAFLRSWRGPVLFISHDRSFVNKVCTHIIGIKRSKIKKVEGKIDDYQNLIEIYEQTHERTRENIEKKKAQMMSFVDRFGAKASKATQAQSRLKSIEKMDSLDALQQEQNLAFRFNYRNSPNKVVFSAQDLQFSYDKSTKLIHDLSFEVEKEDRVAIIGKNGSGKSTLMRLLSEQMQPDSGHVKMSPNTEMGYFGQTNIDRLNSKNTIEEELISAFPDASYAKVRSACGAMLFSGEDAKKSISVLSGGERSRVLLAKLLLTPANLLLLDEPTHHLDLESVDALLGAIEHFSGAVLLVSHDESVLKKFNADKLIICHQKNQEIFLGGYDRFLEKKGWEEEGGSPSCAKKESKQERKLRAENVQERARALRPIQNRLEKTEKMILACEKKKAELEESMITDSRSPDTDMQDLAFRHGKVVKEVDDLYDQLQTLHDEAEELKKRYDSE